MSVNSEKLKVGELSDKLFELKEVTWEIPTSRIRVKFFDYDVQSPSFSFAGADWNFHLYPYGCTGSDSVGYIRIEIERLDSTIPQHCVRFKSYYMTYQNKEFVPTPITHIFNPKEKTGWLHHTQRESFDLDEIIITKENVVTFKCEMRIEKNNRIETFSQIIFPIKDDRSNAELKENISRQDSPLSTSYSKESSPKVIEQEPESPTYNYKESAEDETELPASARKGCDYTKQNSTVHPDSKMIQDFRDLFLKQEDCDVIINVKGKEFLAHRNILRARSPVFASTFRIDMKEKATGVVDIEDCDPSSFSDFLCYLYCGNTENITMENVFNLFIAADKYDVQDLRSECLEFLKNNLSVDTFCETVTLAFQYFEKELIQLTSDFFAKNLQEIIVTVKWQSFITENPIQSNEVMIKALISDKK